MKKAIIFLAALWSVTAYGQAQTQAGSDTGYIVDASGGKHLVKISQKPQGDMVPALCGGAPCFVQLPGPTPTQPLTEEQKKILDGTFQPPEITAPSNAPVVVLLPKSAPLDPAAALPSYANPEPDHVVAQPPPKAYVNPCDAACQQQSFNNGYAVGQAIGSAIGSVIEKHRISSYCKANPTSTFLTSDGLAIPCPNAPLDSFAQSQIDGYCRDNPGSWIAIGKHRVDCLTPPSTPNLKWAQWEMNGWLAEYKHRSKANATMSEDQIRAIWNYWQPIYCSLAPSRAKYKDLDGKKQTCR